MSALLDAIRRFFYPFLGRGEVADHPDGELTTCPINATPHRCDGEYVIYGPPNSDDEVIADMEKQFPKTKTRRIR